MRCPVKSKPTTSQQRFRQKPIEEAELLNESVGPDFFMTQTQKASEMFKIKLKKDLQKS
jgi:hypothetical protein